MKHSLRGGLTRRDCEVLKKFEELTKGPTWQLSHPAGFPAKRRVSKDLGRFARAEQTSRCCCCGCRNDLTWECSV